MRKRSTIVQYLSNIVLVLLAIVQGIILIPLYLSHIGEYLYGSWLAIGSTVGLLGLIDLGIPNLVSQQAGVFFGAKDNKSLGSLLGTIILFSILIFVFIGVTGFYLSTRIPGWFDIKTEHTSLLITGFRVATVDLVLMLLVGIIGAYLFGLQKPASHMAGAIAGSIASIAVTIMLLFKGYGILAIPYGSIVRPLINLPVDITALLISVWKMNILKKVCFKWNMLKDFFRASLWLGPAKTAQALSAQIDYIVVIKILNPTDVSILNITRKASEMIILVAGRLSASFLSGLAHLHGAQEKEKFEFIVSKLLKVVFYLAAIGFSGFLILNEDFVSIWTGPDVFGGNTLTVLLCAFGAIKLFKLTFYNIIFAMGEIVRTSVSAIVESILQIVLGIIFCRLWGINGIVIAGIVAVISGALIQGLGLLFLLSYSFKRIVKIFVRLISYVILPLAIGYIIHLFWTPSSWIEFALFSMLYMLISCISVLASDSQIKRYIYNNYFQGWI